MFPSIVALDDPDRCHFQGGFTMKRRIRILGAVFSMTSLPAMQGYAAAQANAPVVPPEATVAVGECRFRIKNMFDGEIEVSKHDNLYPMQAIYFLPDVGPKASAVIRTFALFCVNANDREIGTQLDARQVNGTWFSYNPWPGKNRPELTPFDPDANPRTVRFRGSNWTGTGLTVDSTTGDEGSRARTFRFCLIHEPHALCGVSPVQWLADPDGRNELWKIRAILESVEFVDALAVQ